MKTKPVFYYVRKYEFCDRDHFWIVKGIAVLAALIAWFCEAYLDVSNMQPIQWSAAAVFVLCSGFGVSESYLKKRGLFHYWENKIVKVWLPSMVTLMGISLIRGRLLISWLPVYPVALKGDIMYVIFGGYIAFWAAFKFIPNRTVRIITLFGAAAVAFVFVPESFSAKELLFCFPSGVLASQMVWKRRIRTFKGKGKGVLLLSSIAVGAAIWFAANQIKLPYLDTLLWSAVYMAAAVALLVLVWILQPVPVMGVFAPIGMAAYMLYLLHDSVFELLKKDSDWRVFILVIVILFVAAGVLTWLRELLIRWNKNLRRKGKTQLKGSM